MGLFDVFRRDKGGAAGLLDSAGGMAQNIRDAVTGEEHKRKMAELVAKIAAAQSEVNKAESASAHLFVAGWRPFIGWVCGTAIAIEYVVGPFLRAWVSPGFPHLEMGTIQTITVGLLGLGLSVGRTFEKLAGVQGRHK